MVSLHLREELLLQWEGLGIHEDFAVAILLNSTTVGHVPWEISKSLLVFLAEESQRDDLYCDITH